MTNTRPVKTEMATDLTARRRVASAIPWMLLGLVIFSAAVRAWLSAKLLLRHDVASRLLVIMQWRDIDSFAGWFGMLVLAFAGRAYGGATRKLVPWVVGAGVLVAAASLFTWEWRGAMDLAAVLLLALAAAMIGLRQISRVTLRQGQAGVTIDHLWQLLTVQWMLVWVAAEVFLRWRFREMGMMSEGPRRLLFGLAVFGFLPNVLLAVALGWWPTIAARTGETLRAARPRAWVVSLLAYNLGAIGLVASCIGVPWVGAVGWAAAMIGVGLYFAGFGKSAWAKARFVPLAWLAFAIGALLFLLEGLSEAGLETRMQYQAGWQFLVSFALPLLWLIGMATLWARGFVAEKWRAAEASKIAKVLVVLGVAVTVATLIAGPGWLDLVSSGIAMLLAGILLAAVIAARAIRSARL